MLLSKECIQNLLAWFEENKRPLPWRETDDPYKILVSEVMLQQTRVEAVKEYYLSFLARFPSAKALSEASEDEVLKAWEGLGYYSRAKNLHAAAKEIAASGFPQTYKGIRALKGVGDYTAGAVASIAFSLKEPAVDGNVLRVLSRLFASQENIDEPEVRAYFKNQLRACYPDAAREFTEALMELGALVCVPNGAPMCGACPWKGQCIAHSEGKELFFPVREKKKERKIVNANVYVLYKEGKFALEKRGKGLLAGMYGFPFFENGAPMPAFGRVLSKKSAKHIFTHVEWHMTGYLVEAEEFFPQYEWKTKRELFEECAIPSAFKAFLKWAEERDL